jgi:uncharacterized protein
VAATQPEPTDDALRALLADARTIAIVGLSDDPSRPSRRVARYLRGHGYCIIPVNPLIESALGEPARSSVAELAPGEAEIVCVFRRPEHVPAIAEAAIAVGVRALWLQEGIRHDEAAARAREAGLLVVMDRCIAKEHSRLLGPGGPAA